MHLKEARDKNKLKPFIEEKEKTHPVGSHRHFHRVVNSMALRTLKPKPGTSKKGSGAS